MLLTVAQVTALNEVLELAGVEAASRVRQLERPQEIGGLLEVGAHGVNLVDQILHADNAVLAKRLLNDGVVGQGNALLVDLAVAALVDQLLDALQVGVAVGDPGLDNLDHLLGSLGNADKHAVVDLQKTQDLQSLAGLGRDFVDTLDANNKDQVVLSRDMEGVVLLCETRKTNLLALSITVLLDVLLGALEDDATLDLVGLMEKSLLARLHSKAQAINIVNVFSVNDIRPERWYFCNDIDLKSSWQMYSFASHRKFLPLPCFGEARGIKFQLTALRFSISAVRSARAFSWLLRFFRRVSGTKMWSCVGTELLNQIST